MCDNIFSQFDYGGPCEEDSYGNMVEEQQYRNRFEQALNQSFPPVIPGINTPLEVQMKDGRSFTLPPQQQPNTYPDSYIPGGVTTYQGGLNPLTGVIEPTISSQGFSYDPLTGQHQIQNNGYASYEAYPSYNPYAQPACTVPSYGPPAVMTADSPNGFTPYYPGCHQSPNSPYYNNQYTSNPWQNQINHFYQTQHLYQNSWNQLWQEILYDSDASGLDTRTVLSEIIPSDEIKEKIIRNAAANNGYYNPWQANQLAQQEYEKSIEEQKQFILQLFRITHAYLKDDIDEEEIKKTLYPEPPKPFNPVTATKEEKDEYDKILKQQEKQRIFDQIEMQKQMRDQMEAMRPFLLQKIKESHDRILGIQPGQSYDWKYFSENAYKLLRQVTLQKARQAQRDGTKKYNQNFYRAGLSTINKRPIPVNYKDDECVATDVASRFYKSSNLQPTKLNGIMKDEFGNLVYVGIPVDATEKEAHDHFLEQLGYKKRESDARKAVR